MSVKPIVKGHKTSKFDLGDKVKTPSGLVGEIIGIGEYYWGWEYRVHVSGKKKTMYRHENQLTLVRRGTKARREYWMRLKGRFHG